MYLFRNNDQRLGLGQRPPDPGPPGPSRVTQPSIATIEDGGASQSQSDANDGKYQQENAAQGPPPRPTLRRFGLE